MQRVLERLKRLVFSRGTGIGIICGLVIGIPASMPFDIWTGVFFGWPLLPVALWQIITGSAYWLNYGVGRGWPQWTGVAQLLSDFAMPLAILLFLAYTLVVARLSDSWKESGVKIAWLWLVTSLVLVLAADASNAYTRTAWLGLGFSWTVLFLYLPPPTFFLLLTIPPLVLGSGLGFGLNQLRRRKWDLVS